MTLIKTAKRLWSLVTGSVATVCGLAGAALLLLEGQVFGMAAVGFLLAIRYVATTAIRRPRPSVEALANWSGVHAMTTAVCLALPFYVTLSM
jgi:hypothetical protein